MKAAIADALTPVRQQISDLQQEVLLLKGTVRPGPEPACPEPFVVMPERFEGSRASLSSFKMDCELLFALKPRTYATDYIKVLATINLLTGPIKTWAHQVLQERSPVLDSWEAFMLALDSHCTVSKKTRVPKSAPSSSGLRGPRDRNTLYRYDFKPPQYVPSHEALTPQSLDVPVDIHTPTLEDVEPMEIGVIQTTLSKAERERRRGCGLCFYCGERGHLISLCPTRPPRPKVLQVGTTGIHSAIAAVRPVNCQGCRKACPCSMTQVGSQTTVVNDTSAPLEPATNTPVKLLPSGLEATMQPPDNRPVPVVIPRSTVVNAVTSPCPAKEPPPAPETPSLHPKKTPVLDTVTTSVKSGSITNSCPAKEVLPPDCMYASNGTLIRKQELEMFEKALQVRRISPAETSKEKDAQRWIRFTPLD